MVVSGWVIHYMREELAWPKIDVYRAVFWGYAAFGVIKLVLTLLLSKACEAEKKQAALSDPETAPLLGDGAEDLEPQKKSTFQSLLPEISANSRIIVFNLCLLFALDAFASGLAPL
jgi:hypothetical protein